jgi:hypothetical protein
MRIAMLLGLALPLFAAVGARAQSDIYLPADKTGGNQYCLNPESKALRAALTRKPFATNERLDARALADDLVFLRRALRKEYVGYPVLLHLPDFDVEQLFDERIAKLRRGPKTVTFGAEVLSLAVALRKRLNDSHFFVYGQNRYFQHHPELALDEFQAEVDDSARLNDCAPPPLARIKTIRMARLIRADGSPGYVFTMSAPTGPASISMKCGAQTVTFALRPFKVAEPDADARAAYQWAMLGDTAFIRLRRMGYEPATQEAMAQFVADYPQHRKAKLIVFDLRGNNGGTERFILEWISRARAGVWRLGAKQVVLDGYPPWMKWNILVEAQIAEGRVDDPESVAERDAVRAEWPTDGGRMPPDLFRNETVESGAQEPYTGRVIVVVDRETVSSAESGAWALHQAFDAPIVGERSFGGLEYQNERVLVLPRTGIAWSVPTDRIYFSQPIGATPYYSSFEEVGLPVDMYLDAAILGTPHARELLPLVQKASALAAEKTTK